MKSEEQTSLMQIILTAGSTLLDSINSVLQYVSLETKKESPQPKPFTTFDVRKVVKDILDISSLSVVGKDVKLSEKWNTTASVSLYGNRVELKTVLLNLVSNAVKFTQHGFVNVEANVSDLSTTFVVSDTGRENGFTR